jgi:hypothetical protein
MDEDQPMTTVANQTEELCTALRKLRRNNPKLFFFTPHETLYYGLEAALNSFYRHGIHPDKEPPDFLK